MTKSPTPKLPSHHARYAVIELRKAEMILEKASACISRANQSGRFDDIKKSLTQIECDLLQLQADAAKEINQLCDQELAEIRAQDAAFNRKEKPSTIPMTEPTPQTTKTSRLFGG